MKHLKGYKLFELTRSEFDMMDDLDKHKFLLNNDKTYQNEYSKSINRVFAGKRVNQPNDIEKMREIINWDVEQTLIDISQEYFDDGWMLDYVIYYKNDNGFEHSIFQLREYNNETTEESLSDNRWFSIKGKRIDKDYLSSKLIYKLDYGSYGDSKGEFPKNKRLEVIQRLSRIYPELNIEYNDWRH